MHRKSGIVRATCGASLLWAALLAGCDRAKEGVPAAQSVAGQEGVPTTQSVAPAVETRRTRALAKVAEIEAEIRRMGYWEPQRPGSPPRGFMPDARGLCIYLQDGVLDDVRRTAEKLQGNEGVPGFALGAECTSKVGKGAEAKRLLELLRELDAILGA